MSRFLEVHGVTKQYGTLKALDNVSIRWTEGQIVALIGANGGGKSTLLKHLAGTLTPDSGSIEGIDAFTVASMPDRLAFARGWTARAWLQMVASWKKAPMSRVDAVLKEVELEHVAQKPVATFSQGMVRRLLWAQTRLTDADLVLLDEPEGGLDPQWVVRLQDELDRLRAEGRTVVFSTHWLDLAVERADQLVVFAKGHLVTIDDAEVWRKLSRVKWSRRLVDLIGPAS